MPFPAKAAPIGSMGGSTVPIRSPKVTSSFEGGGGDDHRASARWFLENLTQPRSLCSAQSSQNPDRDWVKFTVFSGITYTLEIAAPEEHVRASIELDASCGTVASSQAGPLLWQSPINGICYAGVEQAALVGPLTAYSLTLRSASGVVDLYEPDDSCAQAHDLPTNGVRQSHLFQLPADADWVKFNVEAGSTFQMVAGVAGDYPECGLLRTDRQPEPRQFRCGQTLRRACCGRRLCPRCQRTRRSASNCTAAGARPAWGPQ
ncbi:MAG: hypothetical protein NTV69_17110 [Caldilinea sp.]|nr:hypothetical protein [Caldilinea sp.]